MALKTHSAFNYAIELLNESVFESASMQLFSQDYFKHAVCF